MVYEGDYSTIKIIDFGECRRLDPHQTFVGSPIPTGTDEYAPPEQIKDGPLYIIRPKSDIFALGSISVDIYSGANKFTITIDHKFLYHYIAS